MEDIRLSLDAYTLDRTVGKQRVKTIEQDGSLIYDTPKPPGADFSDQVERLWTEYPEGLLDITEEQLSLLPGDDDAVPQPAEAVEGDKAERDPSQIMTAEDMETLRSEVFLQLNDARNELWYVLELAKTLSISTDFASNPPPFPGQPPIHPKKRKAAGDAPSVSLQPGVEPPLLPAGTFSTTVAVTPLQPALSAYDLQLALAAKQEALEECSDLIDGAVEELQVMSDAGDRFWQSLRTLKDGKGGRGQWAIVPRPDFGRNMAEGERAKDVIIPYAVDEAPPALRARSLAAFDLDPAKLDSLTFGARTHQRLRVTLEDQNGLHCSTLALEPSPDDVGALMETVQAESFDEDLFNELRLEAMKNDYSVEAGRISVPIADKEVAFEMYDTRTPPTTGSISSESDLILDLARLSLHRLHRHRKSRLIIQASRLAPTVIPGPAILAPILQGLKYQQTIQAIKAGLSMFVNIMRSSGIVAEMRTVWAGADEKTSWSISGNNEGLLDGLEGDMSLSITGLHGILVHVSPVQSTTITTPKSTFPLGDPSDLPAIMAEELELQLLSFAEQFLTEHLREKGAETDSGVFMDELDGVISLPHGYLSINIPAPYSTISARIEPHDTEDIVDIYNPKESDLRSWLVSIAEQIE